jgi:polar amino acid transport system substrate-binding protein
MNKRALVSLLAAPALAFSLAACGSNSGTPTAGGSSGPSLNLVQDGKLTVCSDVPYAPFEDFDSSTPTGFKGFDVDIMSKIAQKLGLTLVWQDSDFNALKSGVALNARQCDLVASAMTINPERQAKMDFSDPYFDADQSLLVPDGSSIHTLGDLNGKKLGVQNGTTGETYANEHATGAQIVSMPDDGTEFQALKSGQVDALLQDLPVNALHATAGGYAVVETYKTSESYGFAMKKGNTGLVDAVDGALAAVRSSGDYKTIYDTYFPKK